MVYKTNFWFWIYRIQADNGREFANDHDMTDKVSAFMRGLVKEYQLQRIRPYSTWQNGKIERSHREDEKIFYHGQVFYRERELVKKSARHERRRNKTAKKVWSFRISNQVVADFFAL